jgi:hypothetical protein
VKMRGAFQPRGAGNNAALHTLLGCIIFCIISIFYSFEEYDKHWELVR